MTVFVVLLSTLFIYMILITVIEAPLYYLDFMQQSYKKFIYPSVALWNGVITLFTVGYGDTFVVTYLGRIVVTILSIFGSILISFVTVAILTDFSLKDQDD